jgi:hypothetical protein
VCVGSLVSTTHSGGGSSATFRRLRPQESRTNPARCDWRQSPDWRDWRAGQCRLRNEEKQLCLPAGGRRHLQRPMDKRRLHVEGKSHTQVVPVRSEPCVCGLITYVMQLGEEAPGSAILPYKAEPLRRSRGCGWRGDGPTSSAWRKARLDSPTRRAHCLQPTARRQPVQRTTESSSSTWSRSFERVCRGFPRHSSEIERNAGARSDVGHTPVL